MVEGEVTIEVDNVMYCCTLYHKVIHFALHYSLEVAICYYRYKLGNDSSGVSI